MADKKDISAVSLTAINKVLSMQKNGAKWDGTAHAAGLSFLAEAMLSAPGEAKANRIALMKEIGATTPQWTYASNMKKLLIEHKLIGKSELEAYS